MSAEIDPSPRLLRLKNWANHRAPLGLAFLIFGYLVFFSVLACQKLYYFRQGFDMAGNEQAIWNTLHGRPFRTSVFAFMQYDFDDGPVLLQIPLALVYAIHQSPYTLLVLQTLALAIAAWPVYLIGRDLLPQRWHALTLAAIYLIHPTTQHINMYEFQLRSFMIPFALGALLFLRRQKLGWYALFLCLMMFTKTEAGFTLVAFGAYALLSRKPWRFAAIPLVLGPSWIFVALGIIVPRFSQDDFITKIYSYGKLGESVGDVIKTMITNPGLTWQVITIPAKLSYLLRLFSLTAFLAFFSPTLILALPILMLNLISPNGVQFSLNYQYGALAYPFLIVAMAEGLVNLLGWSVKHSYIRQRLISAGVLGLLLIGVIGNLTLNNVVKSALTNRESPQRVADARAIIAQVPPHAAVAASTFLAPHLAQREEIYFFPGNPSYPAEYVDRAEYIVLDRRPIDKDPELLAALDKYLNHPEWQTLAEQGDFVLLQRP